MPTKDYKSVRNIIDSGDVPLNDSLKKFANVYKVCPKCDGSGKRIKDEDITVQVGIATIKVKGNEVLEKLNECGNLNSDIINRMIETVVYGKNECNKCKGFKFVPKLGKAKSGSGKT